MGCLECGDTSYVKDQFPHVAWYCPKCTDKILQMAEKHAFEYKSKQITRVTGICTICWENSTKDCKYDDVCDKCLPLTKKD